MNNLYNMNTQQSPATGITLGGKEFDFESQIIKKENGGMFLPQMVFRCEIAYPCLLRPSELTGKKGLTMVFEVGSQEHKRVQAAVDALSMAYCGRPDSQNANPRVVIKDKGGLAGKVAVGANRNDAKGPLVVVDGQKNRLSEQEIAEVGGTSLCNVAVCFFGYSYMSKKGVSCSLQGLQVIEARHSQSDPFGVVPGAQAFGGSAFGGDDMDLL